MMRESQFVVATTNVVPMTRDVSIKWCYFIMSLPGKHALCAPRSPHVCSRISPMLSVLGLGSTGELLGLHRRGKRQQCCGTLWVGTLVFLHERDTKGEKNSSGELRHQPLFRNHPFPKETFPA